jgi:DinB superfamily
MTPEERQELISQYEAGYDEVVKSLDGFPADKLTMNALPGKWSACEIVQHLADSEMNSAIRLRRLLAEDRPVIHAYDQEDYARRLKYNERDMMPALESLRSSRATTAQLLTRMSDEDWKREGWHPESGLYSAEIWLKIYAAHAHNHAAQIRRLKEVVSNQ